MAPALIVIFYLIDVWLAWMALRRIDFTRIQFIDGVVVGLTYYVTIPFAIILIYGRVGPDFMPLQDYLPYQDLSTTAVILIGSAAVYLCKADLWRLAGGMASTHKAAPPHGSNAPATVGRPHRRAAARGSSGGRGTTHYLYTLIAILIIVDLGAALYTFRAAGLASGGHWYHAVSDLMAESPGFLFIKHAQNYARTAVFGALAMVAVASPRKTAAVLGIGALLAIADLFLTFNRITIVYLAFMILMVSGRHVGKVTLVIMALLFSGIYVSSLWPEFRGRLSETGYSAAGMATALGQAIEVNSRQKPLVDQMNGMFESINFTTLNWIVNFSDRMDVTPGSYLIRPMTVFIPRSVWPSRPASFATSVGSFFSDGELAVNSFLFGEPFSNTALLWPLLMVGVILLYNAIFKALSRSHRVWGAIGALIGFAWWRFDSSFPVVSIIISMMIYSGFYLFASPKGRQPRRSLRQTKPAPSAG